MSTRTTETSNAFFNPQSMGAFQGMTGAMAPAVQQDINSPFNNPWFNTQSQMGTNQANQMGQSAMSNITRNWNMMGGSGNNPAYMEMINNQARMNSQMRANLGFLNPMQNALSMRQNALSLAAGYRPLQTGMQQTRRQSGLGSWLPQLVGAGLGMAMGNPMAFRNPFTQGSGPSTGLAGLSGSTGLYGPGFGVGGGGGSLAMGGYNLPSLQSAPNPFMQPSSDDYSRIG